MKDVCASEDTLADIFESIRTSFRCLGTYTEVPQTARMIDIIMEILVEVLSILAITIKEIKQAQISE